MGCTVSAPEAEFGTNRRGEPCPISPSHKSAVTVASPHVAIAKAVHTKGRAVLRGTNYGRIVVHAAHLRQRLGPLPHRVRPAQATANDARAPALSVSGHHTDGWSKPLEPAHVSSVASADSGSLCASLELGVHDIAEGDEGELQDGCGSAPPRAWDLGDGRRTPDTAASQSVRSGGTKHTWISKSMWTPPVHFDGPSRDVVSPRRTQSAGPASEHTPFMHAGDFDTMMRFRSASVKRSSERGADTKWLPGVHKRHMSPPSPVGLVAFLTTDA